MTRMASCGAEGLHGQRKMTAYVRRKGCPRWPTAPRPGHNAVGPQRGSPRQSSTHHDSAPRMVSGPGICATGTSVLPRPNGCGLPTSRTCGPGSGSSMSRSSSTCSPRRSWPGTWPASGRPSWSWSRCGWHCGPGTERATPPSPVSWSTIPTPAANTSSLRFTERLALEQI